MGSPIRRRSGSIALPLPICELATTDRLWGCADLYSVGCTDRSHTRTSIGALASPIGSVPLPARIDRVLLICELATSDRLWGCVADLYSAGRTDRSHTCSSIW